MITVRGVEKCLGMQPAPTLSVLGHIFGFARRRVPTDPDATVTARVSVLQKSAAGQNRHIDLNIIRVGFDAIPAATRDRDIESIDYATYKIAHVYDQVGLSIGRVGHFQIPQGWAGGRDDIKDSEEGQELWDEWTVHNDATDVFIVRTIQGTLLGTSPPKHGDCEKDSDGDGILGGSAGRPFDDLARTFAHENGHFLGLNHNHGEKPACPSTAGARRNLMAQTRCIALGDERESVVLDGGQGAIMHSHCSVKKGC